MDLKVQRTALIDADFIAYQQAAFAHSHGADVGEMEDRITHLLKSWTERAFAKSFITVFSCSRDENFRREEYPPYKMHRTADPPAMLDAAKEILADAGPTISRPHVEADDILGILATNGKVTNPVVVSTDKDLKQIPCWHFNPDKMDFPVKISELEADYVFYKQWLMGDGSDGYPGIKGVGEVKACKMLDGVPIGMIEGVDYPAHAQWAFVVLTAYRDAGKTLDEALQQARCARILRNEDWDDENKAPVLWTPPICEPEGIWEEVGAK